jgi:hypothetical protein
VYGHANISVRQDHRGARRAKNRPPRPGDAS